MSARKGLQLVQVTAAVSTHLEVMTAFVIRDGKEMENPSAQVYSKLPNNKTKTFNK